MIVGRELAEGSAGWFCLTGSPAVAVQCRAVIIWRLDRTSEETHSSIWELSWGPQRECWTWPFLHDVSGPLTSLWLLAPPTLSIPTWPGGSIMRGLFCLSPGSPIAALCHILWPKQSRAHPHSRGGDIDSISWWGAVPKNLEPHFKTAMLMVVMYRQGLILRPAGHWCAFTSWTSTFPNALSSCFNG